MHGGFRLASIDRYFCRYVKNFREYVQEQAARERAAEARASEGGAAARLTPPGESRETSRCDPIASDAGR